MVVCAGDGGDSEEGVEMTKGGIGSSVFEVGIGGKMHLMLFGGCDGIETSAVRRRLAVFDFGEVDIIILG